jgi:hypothetical protein
MSALFAGLLVQPPFLWGFDQLGYVFAGQICTAVAVPLLCGYGSDIVVKRLSKRNNGVSEVCINLTPVLAAKADTPTQARVSLTSPRDPLLRHLDLHHHIRHDRPEPSRLELGRYRRDAQLRVLWLRWHCGFELRLLHGRVRLIAQQRSYPSITDIEWQVPATSRCMSRAYLLLTRLHRLRHLVWHNLVRGHSRL